MEQLGDETFTLLSRVMTIGICFLTEFVIANILKVQYYIIILYNIILEIKFQGVSIYYNWKSLIP